MIMKIKKLLSITAAIICILSAITLCSCAGDDTNDGSDSVDMSALADAMSKADSSLPVMLSADSNNTDAATLFAFLSELSYDKVNDYFYLYSKDGSPYEIAVIELKEADDAAMAAETLRTHVSQRVATYSTYKKEYTAQAENADVVSQGRYVAMIMTAANDSVKNVFRNETKEN